MKSYEKYLKKLKICPFCHLRKEEIIKQNKFVVLTLAKAPYIKNHLLVIPKRHVLTFGSLKKREKLAMLKMIAYGMKKLKKKERNINVLYREGNKKIIRKSINHMHVHIIPNMPIGMQNKKWNKKQIYSDKEYVKKIKELKKRL